MTTESGRGGRRAGAGRPPKFGRTAERRGIHWPPEAWAIVDEYTQDGETATDGLARILLTRSGGLKRLRDALRT